MPILSQNKFLAWIASKLGIGGPRYMWEYKVNYYFNEDYGEMWMPADNSDQAMSKVEKKVLRMKGKPPFYTFSCEVDMLRKTMRF